MYSIHAYGRMIADRVRTDAYLEALRRTVTPSSVVLDIGTGTGIHAVYAAKLGARRVFAVEPDDAIEVARLTAEANGVADRIEFIQARSTDIDLPERADVIVSDLRGPLPVARGHFAAVADARQRFLRPGGTLIPAYDELWVAVADIGEQYAVLDEPWASGCAGLDLRPGRGFVFNVLHRCPEVSLTTEPARWARIDYSTVVEESVGGSAVCPVTAAGTGHGLVLWFSTTLVDGVGFSTHPDKPRGVYGRILLPWLEEVALQPGEGVEIGLRADHISDDYTWTWTTKVVDRASAVRAAFEQSTFFGSPVAGATLVGRREDDVVQLTVDGEIEAALLSAFAAGLSVGEAADEIMKRFEPGFATRGEALQRAADAAQRYSA